MPNFGETLFGGSPFVRWALSPFLVLFVVAMPFLIPAWTPASAAMTAGVEFACLALLAGFWLPARHSRLVFRILAGLVFLGYFAYLVHELLVAAPPAGLAQSRGKASPLNAIKGFLVIGIPCLWYSIFGRFTRKPRADQT